MQCTRCGAILPDPVADNLGRVPKFCTKCGEPLPIFTPDVDSAEDMTIPVNGPFLNDRKDGFRQNAAAAPEQPDGFRQNAAAAPEQPGGFRQNAAAAPEQPGGFRQNAAAAQEQPGGFRQNAAAAPEQPGGFRENAAAQVPPAPVPPTPPVPPAPEPPLGDPGAPRKRKSPVLWIVLAAVAVAALLAVAFFTVHFWKDADCEHPETCAICGKTRGDALGHDWIDATCTEPKTCDRCGETTGDALGHDWLDATCTEPKTCDRCGETEGEPLGHSWVDATYDAPKTCERCGETEGNVLGWVGVPDYDREESTTSIGSSTGHAFVFSEPLVGLRKMTVTFQYSSYEGNPFGTFAVYVHSDARGWYSAQTFQVTAEDQNKELVVPITFEDTPTIDKFIIVGEKNATFSVEYSMGVKDVQIT